MNRQQQQIFVRNQFKVAFLERTETFSNIYSLSSYPERILSPSSWIKFFCQYRRRILNKLGSSCHQPYLILNAASGFLLFSNFLP